MVNAPVAQLVGIGQRRARHGFANAHVIKLGSLRRPTRFDVAQAVAIGELSKGQDTEVLATGQRPDAVINAMSSADAVAGLLRQEVHDLGEKCLANVHRNFRQQQSRQTAPRHVCRSSRRHYKNLRMRHQIRVVESRAHF